MFTRTTDAMSHNSHALLMSLNSDHETPPCSKSTNAASKPNCPIKSHIFELFGPLAIVPIAPSFNFLFNVLRL